MNPIKWLIDWLNAQQVAEEERRAAHIREFQRNAEVSAFFSSIPTEPGPAMDAWLEWHDRLFGEASEENMVKIYSGKLPR